MQWGKEAQLPLDRSGVSLLGGLYRILSRVHSVLEHGLVRHGHGEALEPSHRHGALQMLEARLGHIALSHLIREKLLLLHLLMRLRLCELRLPGSICLDLVLEVGDVALPFLEEVIVLCLENLLVMLLLAISKDEKYRHPGAARGHLPCWKLGRMPTFRFRERL